jgi:transglutaminase-like putative cysteine protease
MTNASLEPTAMVNSDHPAVREFASSVIGDETGARAKAAKLYLAVRDRFRYDPYNLDLSINGLSASRVIESGSGWCGTKAVLLAAACRAVNLPARLGFANVMNHLSTARLREVMGTDIFYYHGYTAILIEGRWLKATPAFNIELCEKLRLYAMEFDGTEDSIYHPYTRAGERHMEYIKFHGEFDDVPRDDLVATYTEHYPKLLKLTAANWDEDVAKETGNKTLADRA